MQQIDRKLKQYYAVDKLEPSNNKENSTNKDNYYKTIDPSQLDNRSSFRDNRPSMLLLKDASKFEYHHSVSVPFDAQHSNGPTGKQNNSNAHNANSNKNKNKRKESIFDEVAESNHPIDVRRLSNRFTVEKIKDNVV